MAQTFFGTVACWIAFLLPFVPIQSRSMTIPQPERSLSVRVYLNPNTGRFWTMDSYEGNNEEPLSLHKYLYCHGNPINGSDPSGHDFEAFAMLTAMDIGMRVTSMSLATIAEAAVALPSQKWDIREHYVDLTQPGISLQASTGGNPDGFWVTYKPNPADSIGGKIVIYQTISATGGGGYTAHVDGAAEIGRAHV